MSTEVLKETGDRSREETFQKLTIQLSEILAGGDPDGYYRNEDRQIEWALDREHGYAEHGEDALINLFPGPGHRGFTAFLSALKRAGILTIPQLIARKDEIREGYTKYPRIKQVGPKRARAARLIISFFEAERA